MSRASIRIVVVAAPAARPIQMPEIPRSRASQSHSPSGAPISQYAPLDYVLSLRMEEAKQMLETSDAAIDDVAQEVGYTEPAAFRRVFKRTTGLSPLQYRQRFRSVAAVEASVRRQSM